MCSSHCGRKPPPFSFPLLLLMSGFLIRSPLRSEVSSCLQSCRAWILVSKLLSARRGSPVCRGNRLGPVWMKPASPVSYWCLASLWLPGLTCSRPPYLAYRDLILGLPRLVLSRIFDLLPTATFYTSLFKRVGGIFAVVRFWSICCSNYVFSFHVLW